ncbi:MAG: SGNH/GDSL hydrolase family protein [Bacteroidaceae bacterium]|nr:SGNH/GDSL hydrolase family protein [Bacteroidaceae bacterium]
MEFRTEPKDFEISETSEEYLEKIYQLCQERNVRLIVAKSIYPCNEVDVGVAQYMDKWCEEHDVPYINYMLLYEELGIDENTDDADGGWHLNETGAAKVSAHMVQFIRNNEYYKKLGEE